MHPMKKIILSAAIIVFTASQGQSGAVRAPEAGGLHPFEFEKNQILLSVKIGGKGPYTMLLDSGVIPSVIDEGLARELGLELDTENAGNAAGRGTGNLRVIPTTIKSLSIGYEQFGDIAAVTIDLSGLSKPLGRELHGILGYSLLKDRIVRIDYAGRTIELFDEKKDLFSRMSGTVYLEKFTLEDNDIMPTIRGLRVNGKKIIATVDTGSSLNVEIFSHKLAELGLAELAKGGKRSGVVGARGAAEITDVTADSIAIGGHRLTDQQLSISQSTDTDNVAMGNIGNGFLKNFTLSLNYRDKELVLEPRR